MSKTVCSRRDVKQYSLIVLLHFNLQQSDNVTGVLSNRSDGWRCFVCGTVIVNRKCEGRQCSGRADWWSSDALGVKVRLRLHKVRSKYWSNIWKKTHAIRYTFKWGIFLLLLFSNSFTSNIYLDLVYLRIKSNYLSKTYKT